MSVKSGSLIEMPVIEFRCNNMRVFFENIYTLLKSVFFSHTHEIIPTR